MSEGVRETSTHGRWRVTLSLGEVGHIEHDGHEVVRAVRVVARDRDWNTFPHQAGPAAVSGGALRVPIEVTDDDGVPIMQAEIAVRMDEDCEVRTSIRPLREMEVNRLGLVVLLSPRLAGRPIVVEHASGVPERTTTLLPRRTAAHQPAVDIHALHYAAEGRSVTAEFSGDVFEMEDQRNWTDASFKVYNRPLALPFPYRVGPRGRIEQAVRFSVRPGGPDGGPTALTDRDRPDGTRDVVRALAARVPEVGTSSSRHVDGPLPPRAPHAGPLLVELTADRASWPEIVARAELESRSLGVPVDLRIVAADAHELERGLAAAGDLRLARVGAFDPVTHVTEAPVWTALRRWRDGRATRTPLIAGSRAHFTELNRTIDRLPRDADLVAFSLTPKMHADDPEHVEESLAIQRRVAEDAVALADGIPVVIGPVTLRRRFNAVATSPSPGSAIEAARGVDPWMGSEYLASWLERSVDAVSVPGVLAGSWFEATGSRGLMTRSGVLTPAGRRWYALVS